MSNKDYWACKEKEAAKIGAYCNDEGCRPNPLQKRGVMNLAQYQILTWLLNVGCKPHKLATRLDLHIVTVISVQNTDSYMQFLADNSTLNGGVSVDEILSTKGEKKS